MGQRPRPPRACRPSPCPRAATQWNVYSSHSWPHNSSTLLPPLSSAACLIENTFPSCRRCSGAGRKRAPPSASAPGRPVSCCVSQERSLSSGHKVLLHLKFISLFLFLFLLHFRPALCRPKRFCSHRNKWETALLSCSMMVLSPQRSTVISREANLETERKEWLWKQAPLSLLSSVSVLDADVYPACPQFPASLCHWNRSCVVLNFQFRRTFFCFLSPASFWTCAVQSRISPETSAENRNLPTPTLWSCHYRVEATCSRRCAVLVSSQYDEACLPSLKKKKQQKTPDIFKNNNLYTGIKHCFLVSPFFCIMFSYWSDVIF